MNFIGIDIGTSFIKGTILDTDQLTLLHIERIPFPGAIDGLPPFHFEIEPAKLVATVKNLIKQLLSHVPHCAGLVLCSQMHGFVLMDPSGNPLTNVITWRDERASGGHPSNAGSYFDMLMQHVSQDDLRALGNGLRPGLPIGTLFWLRENGLLPTGDAVPMSLPDFVMHQLCTNSVVGIEPTNAAAHGLFDVQTNDWHWSLLDKLGLGNLQWPPIRQVDQIIGEFEIQGQRFPVYMPVGDHQCALLGAFLQAKELSLNVSTGSQVSLLTAEFRPGEFETRPFFDGQFLNTFVKIPAGRALDALVALLVETTSRQGLDVGDPWRVIAEQVAAVEETDLSIDLSFYVSVSGTSSGHISNIREETLTVGHLFRAAFKNMTQNFHDYAQSLAPDVTTSGASSAWERLVFSGGLVQKIEPLRDMIVAKFDCPYRMSASSEDTMLGLLALALVVGGQAKSAAEAAQVLRENCSSTYVPSSVKL